MAHGIKANIVHGWRKRARDKHVCMPAPSLVSAALVAQWLWMITIKSPLPPAESVAAG